MLPMSTVLARTIHNLGHDKLQGTLKLLVADFRLLASLYLIFKKHFAIGVSLDLIQIASIKLLEASLYLNKIVTPINPL